MNGYEPTSSQQLAFVILWTYVHTWSAKWVSLWIPVRLSKMELLRMGYISESQKDASGTVTGIREVNESRKII